MTTPLHHAERLRDLALREHGTFCHAEAPVCEYCNCTASDHNAEVQAAFEQLRDALPNVLPKEEPELITRYYMRDNHTFARLSDDNDKALTELHRIYLTQCSSGMLCGYKGEKHLPNVHASDGWLEFRCKAAQWLNDHAVLPLPPEPTK